MGEISEPRLVSFGMASGEGGGEEAANLGPDFGVMAVDGVDGDAEEGIGVESAKEESVPEETDGASEWGADAPDERLGVGGVIGGEIEDRAEASGIRAWGGGESGLGEGAEEPGWGDEACGVEVEFFEIGLGLMEER